jgi:hypothetical protein
MMVGTIIKATIPKIPMSGTILNCPPRTRHEVVGSF